MIFNGLKGRQITVKYQARNGRTKSYQVPFEGVIPNLNRRYATTSSDYIKEELGKYMAANPCPTCNGTRLRREILSVLVDGMNIVEVSRLPIRRAQEWAERLSIDPDKSPDAVLTAREYLIGRQIMKEVRERLGFPGRCWARLPDHGSCGQHAFWRRGATHPAGHPDWLGPHGCALHSR